MDQLALATQFYVPPILIHSVPRQRLLDRLAQNPKPKLVLLSAPAGYGKTTLLSQWVNTPNGHSPRMAWISLRERDNKPSRFWNYLLSALEPLGLTNEANVECASELTEDCLTALIDKIAAEIPDPFTLILDDYHLITTQPIHDAVNFLLDYMPPQMRVVISTRSDPPLPLAQLRARGQLLEIRASDLRFTFDEIHVYLNESMQLDLSSDVIATLENKTEGWIASLQLAGLSLRNCNDTLGFVHAFAGTHHHIADYLAEQVLSQQSADIQDFLLKTCVLERLTGSLCDAVTGHTDGQASLDWLAQANLFVIPLDDERRWYRYHHLFADFLREHLQRTMLERTEELYRRAAQWCQDNALIEEAIHYVLQAKDYGTASNLIERVALAAWNQSEIRKLLDWLTAFPDDLIRTSPTLCVYAAWAFAITGQLDLAESYLQSLDTHIESCVSNIAAKVGEWNVQLDILRAFIARFRGNLADAIACGRSALEKIAEENLYQRGQALLFLGHAHLLSGNAREALPALFQARDDSHAAGNLAACASAAHYLAQLFILQGRLRRAEAIYQHTLRAVDDQRHPPATGIEFIGIGDVMREQNDLEQAARYIEQGLRLAERGGDFVFRRDGYVARARLEQALGNWDAAGVFIEKAMRVARRSNTAQVEAWQARLWLGQGNLAAAENWAQTAGLYADDELSFPNEFPHLVLARLWLAQGRTDKAEHLLRRLIQSAEAGERIGRVIEMLAVQALALQSLGKPTDALAALRRALTLAEPEGYARVFIDEGAAMAQLLTQVSQNKMGKVGAYALKLRNVLASQMKEIQPVACAQLLSNREAEILRLIAAGHSYQEIARQLVIALGTVQWHIKNIYQKLDAHSGMEAVMRARELQVLA
jgi:LuxR family maltose regulon positive regulatory protein